MTTRKALDHIDAFQNGQSKVYDMGDIDVLVIRINDDFYAIENRCSHDDQTLQGGECDGQVIHCPRHGAQFSLRSGEALTPPAYEPIRVFDLHLENGTVFIEW